MSKKRIALLALVGLMPLVIALWIAGFDVNSQLGRYVKTDNAVVSANLTKVTAPAAGFFSDLGVKVGDTVQSGGRVGAVDTAGQRRDVVAPATGRVVSLDAAVGQTVVAGQPLLTLADPKSVFVEAMVDENRLTLLSPGQRAEVYLPGINRTLPGTLDTIAPVATGLDPVTGGVNTREVSGAKAPAQVPVRIKLDAIDESLPLGVTGQVRIYTAS